MASRSSRQSAPTWPQRLGFLPPRRPSPRWQKGHRMPSMTSTVKGQWSREPSRSKGDNGTGKKGHRSILATSQHSCPTDTRAPAVPGAQRSAAGVNRGRPAFKDSGEKPGHAAGKGRVLSSVGQPAPAPAGLRNRGPWGLRVFRSGCRIPKPGAAPCRRHATTGSQGRPEAQAQSGAHSPTAPLVVRTLEPGPLGSNPHSPTYHYLCACGQPASLLSTSTSPLHFQSEQ